MTTRIRQLEGVGNRKDYYYVDPRRITVQGGWNPRTDFEGEENLKASIVENGVQVPLRVRRGLDDQVLLIDGERRLRAVLAAIADGHDIQAVPCIFERNGISDAEALLLALVTNQGKPLDPTEEAGAFRRFTAWGLTIQDIARRIGRSDEFIRQRLALVDASPEVRQAVKAGEISIGQGVRIVKSANGNLSEQRAALDLAPKKNERQPRLPLYDRIVAQAQKLPRGKVLDLIGRLNLLVDEMKEKEAAEN